MLLWPVTAAMVVRVVLVIVVGLRPAVAPRPAVVVAIIIACSAIAAVARRPRPAVVRLLRLAQPRLARPPLLPRAALVPLRLLPRLLPKLRLPLLASSMDPWVSVTSAFVINLNQPHGLDCFIEPGRALNPLLGKVKPRSRISTEVRLLFLF